MTVELREAPDGISVPVDEAEQAELRRYWMRCLGPGFVLDVRCLRVFEGRHVIAVHADEYAGLSTGFEVCGRPRRRG